MIENATLQFKKVLLTGYAALDKFIPLGKYYLLICITGRPALDDQIQYFNLRRSQASMIGVFLVLIGRDSKRTSKLRETWTKTNYSLSTNFQFRFSSSRSREGMFKSYTYLSKVMYPPHPLPPEHHLPICTYIHILITCIFTHTIVSKQCDQIERQFGHFGKKFKCLWQIFDRLFLIWQNVEPTLRNLVHYWANFYCCKQPNIEK